MENLARMIQGLKDSFLSMLGMNEAQAEESGIAGFFDFLIGLFTGQTETDVQEPTPSPDTMVERLRDGATLFNNFRTTAEAGRTWDAMREAHRAAGGGAVQHINPVDANVVVTSDHGPRTPVRNQNGTMSSSDHRGLDLDTTDGTIPNIVASADGIVLFAGEGGGYGNCVIIGHADGTYTFYGHLENIAENIVVGGAISQNHILGRMGDSGNATAEHLHYEQRRGRESINPRINGSVLGDDAPLRDFAASGVTYDGDDHILENSLPARLVEAMRAAGVTVHR